MTTQADPERKGWRFGFGRPNQQAQKLDEPVSPPIPAQAAVDEPPEHLAQPDGLPPMPVRRKRKKRRNKRWDQPGRRDMQRVHTWHAKELIEALHDTAHHNRMTIQDLVDYGIRHAILDYDGVLPELADDPDPEADQPDPDGPELPRAS
jgi:hypothetical protein